MAKSRAPQAKKKIGGPRVKGEPRPEKVAAVQMVKDRLTGSAAVILTEYRGLTVGDLAELRTNLRTVGAEYKVVKNSLSSIAAREVGLDDLLPLLEGPTAIVWAGGDAVAAAKQIAEFAKKVPALVVKGGVLEGRALNAAQTNALATIESREVLLSKTAGLFASGPQRLVNIFAAPLNKLGAALAALRDKLEKAEAA